MHVLEASSLSRFTDQVVDGLVVVARLGTTPATSFGCDDVMLQAHVAWIATPQPPIPVGVCMLVTVRGCDLIGLQVDDVAYAIDATACQRPGISRKVEAPGTIDVFDAKAMEKLDSVATEKGTHTFPLAPQGDHPYAFLPATQSIRPPTPQFNRAHEKN